VRLLRGRGFLDALLWAMQGVLGDNEDLFG
jgi:hypothetical protein